MKIRSCPSPDCVCVCGRGRRVSRGGIKVFSGLYPQLPNMWQWITRASDNFNNDITRLSYQSLLRMARMRHGLLWEDSQGTGGAEWGLEIARSATRQARASIPLRLLSTTVSNYILLVSRLLPNIDAKFLLDLRESTGCSQ